MAQNTKLQFHSAEGKLGKSFSPRIVLSDSESQTQEVPDEIPYMEDPNQSYEILPLKYATDLSFHREVYLRFDLSTITATFDKATLILNVEGIDQNVEFSFNIG